MRNRAFTLLEMMVALALTVLLMTALLGVASSAVRSEAFVAKDGFSSANDRLYRVLVEDVSAAVAMKLSPERIEIQTHSGFDAETWRRGGGPASVVYRLIGESDEPRYLVRDQSAVVDGPVVRSILLSGIESFSLEPEVKADVEDPLNAAATITLEEESGWTLSESELPTAFRFRFGLSSSLPRSNLSDRPDTPWTEEEVLLWR